MAIGHAVKALKDGAGTSFNADFFDDGASNFYPGAPLIVSRHGTFSAALTVTAASAYATGNAIGAKLSFASFLRITGGMAAIRGISLNSKSLQTFTADVVFFEADPTGTTITDKTALTVAAADFDKVAGVAQIVAASWVALGTPSVAQVTGLYIPIKPATTLYAAVICRGTPTFTATTDLKLTVRAEVD